MSTTRTRQRICRPPPASVDVAIIGAGISGLTAGAYLARQGLSVACFDPHYVAGGCTTRFSRGRDDARYHFDVGLHYIGDCGPDGQIPTLLRGVGVELAYSALDPDGFDVLLFPELTFKIPSSRALYRDRLVEAFPRERRGIDRYIRFLKELDTVVQSMQTTSGKMTPSLVWTLLTRGRLVARSERATLAELLDSCTADPLLRAVIAGQNGDYALPPSRVSALLHGGLCNHYFRGAHYPIGGGQIIADKVAEAIEDAGGSIHLRCGVGQIRVQDGAAVGVITAPHRGEPRSIDARIVLSAADLKATLTELLPREHLPPAQRRTVEGYELPAALFITFLGIRGPIEGMRAANYWQFDSCDFEASYAEIEGSPAPTTRCAYITSASYKDPTGTDHAPAGITNVEVMSIVSGDLARWSVRPDQLHRRRYHDSSQYQAHKARIESDLIARLDAVFPGTGQRVVFSESATPVTHSRYTHASGGTGYGIACTPAQFGSRRPGCRGPVPGLYLCGASTRSGHGILGAMMSGHQAARRISAALGRPLPPLHS